MGRPNPFDEVSRALLTIDHEHHNVHEGDAFTFTFSASAPLPTAVDESTALAFVTPAATVTGKRIHMTVDAGADDESIFEIHEAPVVGVNQGTSATPLNRDRNSSNTSVMTDRETGAADRISQFNVLEAAAAGIVQGAAATVLHSEVIAIAAGPPFGSVLNDRSRGRKEFILLPATVYAILLSNVTVNDTVHKITLNWYEHEDSTLKVG